jgi:hypothetical protein
MYIGQDFNPVDQVENAVYGIDFVNDLPEGASIASADVTCTNAPDSQVYDPTPSARIIAGPFISGTQVLVRISEVLPNAKYLLQFVVTTDGASVISIFTHMPGEALF